MNANAKRRDRLIIAAVTLLALHFVLLTNLFWAMMTVQQDHGKWPLYPAHYEIELVTKDEFARLKDNSVREITFSDGRKFIKTPNWHPIMLDYYKPINNGEQYVRVTGNGSAVYADVLTTHSLAIAFVAIPAFVVCLWNLAIAVRRRYEAHDASLRIDKRAQPKEKLPPNDEGGSRSVAGSAAGVAKVQPVSPMSSRTMLGLALIIIGLALYGVIRVAWAPRDGIAPWIWGLYPIFTFTLIGLLAFRSRFSSAALIGAAVGCAIVLAVPFGVHWYTTFRVPPAGANIGVIFMFLLAPVILPFVGMLAGAIGSEVGRILNRT